MSTNRYEGLLINTQPVNTPVSNTTNKYANLLTVTPQVNPTPVIPTQPFFPKSAAVVPTQQKSPSLLSKLTKFNTPLPKAKQTSSKEPVLAATVGENMTPEATKQAYTAISNQPKLEPTKTKIVGQSLKAGGKQVLKTIGNASNELSNKFYSTISGGRDAFGQPFQEEYTQNKALYKQYGEEIQKELVDKLGEKAANSLLSQGIQGVSQAAGQAAAFIANPGIGYGMIAALVIDSGATAYDDALEKTGDKKIANINGYVTGAINSLEALSGLRAAGGFSKEIFEKPVKVAATKAITKFLKSVAIETTTEGIQQYGQDVTAQLTYKKEKGESLGKSLFVPLKDAIIATIVSVPSALLFGTIGTVNDRIRNKVKQEIAEKSIEAGMDEQQAKSTAETIVNGYVAMGDKKLFENKQQHPLHEEVTQALKTNTPDEVNLALQKELGHTPEEASSFIAKVQNRNIESARNNPRQIEIPQSEAVQKINEYKERLKLDFDVALFNTIYTGIKDTKAYGVMKDNTIGLAEKVTEFTADHEVGHLIFQNLENIPLFKEITQENLLTELSTKYPEMNNKQLEEQLQVEYETFVKQKLGNKPTTFTGKLKEYFVKLFESIKKMLSLGDKHTSNIEDFYTKMYEGKADTKTVLQNKGELKSSDKVSFNKDNKAVFKVKQDNLFGDNLLQKEDKNIKDVRNVVNKYKSYEDFLIDGISQEDKKIIENSGYKTIKDFYEETKNLIPIKVNPSLKGVQMPEHLQDTNENLIQVGNEIKNNPITNLKKYKATSGEFKGKLPEVTGGDKKHGNKFANEFAKNGDKIISELFEGNIDSEKARELFDIYTEKEERYKKQLKSYRENLKQWVQEKKTEIALNDIAEKQGKQTDKLVDIETKKQIKIVEDFINEKISSVATQKTTTGSQTKAVINNRDNSKISVRESVLLKNKIQALSKGSQIGSLDMRNKIESIQKELVNRVRINLPISERGKVAILAAIKNATTPKGLERANEIINTKINQYDKAKQLSKEMGSERSKIAFIKHIGEMDSVLIRDVKKQLGLTDVSTKDMSLEQLQTMSKELINRLKFKENNTVSYFKTTKLKSDTKRIETLKNTLDVTVNLLERRLNKISVPLTKRVSSVYQQIAKNKQLRLATAKPVIDIIKKLKDNTLNKALLEGNHKLYSEILTEHGISSEQIQNLREVFDTIRKELVESGIEVPYRKNFFPRKLKPMTEETAQLVLEEKENQLGRKFTPIEKAQVINTLVRGFGPGESITLSGKRFEESRLLETIPEDMLDLYETPDVAIEQYINQATTLVEVRKLFGKYALDIEDFNQPNDKSIGSYVYGLLDEGKIQQKDVAKLKNVLNTLFAYKNSDNHQKVVKGISEVVYPLALSQATNIINQLKDLGQSILLNDIFALQLNTLGSQKITAEDVYLSDPVSELDSGITQSNLSRIILTPFSKLGDQPTLRIFINAAYRRIVKQAQANNSKLRQLLSDMYGEEQVDKIITDLANSNDSQLTEQMKELIYNEVSKIRPISKLQKTEGSIKFPLAYTLKNFTLKQIEFVRSEAIDVIAQGTRNKDAKMVAQGMGKLLAMVTVFGLLGASIDELKDWLLGKTQPFKDQVQDNILQLAGINTYNITQGEKKGFAQQLLQAYLTPASFSILQDTLDKAYVDIKDENKQIQNYSIIKKIPMVGNIIYNRYGNGSPDIKTQIKDAYQKGDSVKANQLLEKAVKDDIIKDPEKFIADADYPDDIIKFKNATSEKQKEQLSTMSLKDLQKYAWFVNKDLLDPDVFAEISNNAKVFVEKVQEGEVTEPTYSKGKIENSNDEVSGKSVDTTERNIIGLALDYAKAYKTDPQNAFKAMFTGEELGKVKGNLVELARFKNIPYNSKGGSEDYMKKQLEKMGISWNERKNYNLEHIIPVKAGGGTNKENLMIIDRETHNSYTPVDVLASKKIQDGEITRKEVTQIMRNLKVDKTITIEEAMSQLQ